MQSAIHIGNNIDASSIAATAKAITDIFAAALECRTSETVILSALEVLRTSAQVSNVTVANCSIAGDSSTS